MVSSFNTSHNDRDAALATSLVKDKLTQEQSADTFYRAAMVISDRKERIKLLQQALIANPFHKDALQAWEVSISQRDDQSARVQLAGILEGAIPLFEAHGWKLVVAMSRMAQFKRHRTINNTWSFTLVAIFSVFGLLAVLYRTRISNAQHIHVQVGPNDTLTVLDGQDPRNVSSYEELERIVQSTDDGNAVPLIALTLVAIMTLALWIIIIL